MSETEEGVTYMDLTPDQKIRQWCFERIYNPARPLEDNIKESCKLADYISSGSYEVSFASDSGTDQASRCYHVSEKDVASFFMASVPENHRGNVLRQIHLEKSGTKPPDGVMVSVMVTGYCNTHRP